ncbi:glycerophosphoryl diester phosphodiesterase membrane domain-containing protein [Kineococcus sp. TBRC 1896]|uniref:Glycerophosphoryl diester phosphodiesterase membrane domain-containing protein n=1 Tax=Kineococcus mangrovi TaxID=1660183 RepID=A0ABV4I6Z8_9ACTN
MGDEQWQRPDDGAGARGARGPGEPAPAAPVSGWGTAPGGPAGGAGPGSSRAPAPRPGIVPLRPLGLGEVWDGAFRAFRQNPKVMVGLSAIVVVATSLVSLLASVVTTRDAMGLLDRLEAGPAGVSADEVFSLVQRSLPLIGVSVVLQLVAVQVLNGMLITSVSRAVLGRTVGFAELWRVCRPRVLRLVGLSLVVSLASLLVGLVTLAPGVLLLVFADSGTGIGLGVAAAVLGALAWAVGAAYLWVKWSMATPAMLLEELGIGAALRRSFRLTRRSFWRLFGIQLLTAAVVYAVVAAVGFPFSLVGGIVSAAVGDPASTGAVLVQQSITTLGSMVGSIVAYPFLASVTALLYVDLRMRREGLDVELHRASLR